MSKTRLPEWWMPMDRPVRTHVIGVGCGAGRALNRLCTTRLDEVTCVAVNTDREALQACRAPTKILLRPEPALTDRGDAGGDPVIGHFAAVQAYDELVATVREADVVILIACLGGGTGTGAAPLIAEWAQAQGCLTVAVVTLPFRFEGQRRWDEAEQGRQELHRRVDTLITIPLQRLLSCVGKQTTLGATLHACDEVVQHTVSGMLQAITEADSRVLLARMGQACVGTGVASGEHRGAKAAWQAVISPLLEPFALKRARAVLLSLTGGPDLTQADVSGATSIVSEMTRANILIRSSWGLADHLPGEVWVTMLVSRRPRTGAAESWGNMWGTPWGISEWWAQRRPWS